MKELAAYLDTLSQKYGFTDAENRKCAELLRSAGGTRKPEGNGEGVGEFDNEDGDIDDEEA